MSYPSSAVAASACPREQRARYVSATRARIAEKRGKVKQKSAACRNRPPGAGPQQRHGTCRARLGRAMASTGPWPAPWIVMVVV